MESRSGPDEAESGVGAREVTVGIIADPGLPTMILEQLSDRLVDTFTERVDRSVSWKLETSRDILPLNDKGEVPLEAVTERMRAKHGWDLMVYLTDLPRLHNGEPLVCDINAPGHAALISVPALGILRVSRRALRVIVEALRVMISDDDDPSADVVINSAAGARLAPIRHGPSGETANSFFQLKGVRGYVRLLTGMVRSNRPWRLLPSLSGALAASAATGAFGVFYTSIWTMADHLSPARLAMISLFAIGIMATWLIAHNNLWERPSGHAPRRRAVLYNSFTIGTVATGVIIMYLTLYLVLFLAALAVINVDFLASQLGHDADAWDYLSLTWLSASMGAVAGALGSSFDNEEAIRSATYSRRENERHKLIEARDNDSGDDEARDNESGDDTA
ncbi:hypothetical protein LWF01_17815 [Saxibacter everestensis]|uniref:DUF2267 domain-containing protein n=1 Tax=Saxibacter everestensis TaxID=2909229 RepID=A0ABY8QU50_9MICO|nr:hypothetical protein LWF01_17815 [Brevibacteriaceae bacterium ZFBP1038]